MGKLCNTISRRRGQGLNKFALKSKLYINAIRQAFDELQQLKSATA
jgi:hypothetical protein